MISVPAHSQFTQYTAAGSLVEVPENKAERVQKGAESARWRLGRLRLEPHLTLSNVGYSQNVFSAPDETTRVDDSHATLGAGLAGYVRFGAKSMISGFVAPEYFWWQKSENLRSLGVNSGLVWFGSFNRLTLSASASSIERERLLSNEIEAPVQISDEDLTIDASVMLTRRLAVFAIQTNSRVRHGREVERFVPGLNLETLDRDNTRRTIGLELRGSDLEFGIGYEETDVDFVKTDSRDDTGEGPSVRLSYDRNRLNAYLTYADLKLDYEDPAIPEGRQRIGRGLVSFRIRPDTTVSVYAAEGLAFTTISSTGIIETETRGLQLKQGFGRRLEASVFVEDGTQTFVDSDNPGRVDNLEAYGLRILFELTDNLALTGQLREETWDSTFDDFDRSTSSVGFGIEFGGDLLPW